MRSLMVEGEAESIVSDIATLKTLDEEEVTMLGLYRQAVQALRQASVRGTDDETLLKLVPSDKSYKSYDLFVYLNATLSRIIVESREEPTSVQAQKNLAGVVAVGGYLWEKAIDQLSKSSIEPKEDRLASVIRDITGERLAGK